MPFSSYFFVCYCYISFSQMCGVARYLPIVMNKSQLIVQEDALSSLCAWVAWVICQFLGPKEMGEGLTISLAWLRAVLNKTLYYTCLKIEGMGNCPPHFHTTVQTLFLLGGKLVMPLPRQKVKSHCRGLSIGLTLQCLCLYMGRVGKR